MRNKSYLRRLFSRRDFPFDLKKMLFFIFFFKSLKVGSIKGTENFIFCVVKRQRKFKNKKNCF